MKMDRDRLFAWAWEMRPTTVEEFDQMMVSLDRHLASLGRTPEQRPLNAALLVSSKLGLSGTTILPAAHERGEPFSPADLLARVHDWYDASYGSKLNIDFSPGSIVVSLHGNLWEMKMPKVWGHFQPFITRDMNRPAAPQIAVKGSSPIRHNILWSIEGMTEAYAARLSQDDLLVLAGKFVNGYPAMVCLDDLKGHDLFDEARGDYRHSVDALLTGREIGKARSDTALCAEKVLKGLLARDGYAYPTSGQKGHDIVHLGELIKKHLLIDLPASDLKLIYCSPAVRYAEQKETIEDALAAHQALVRVLQLLAKAEVHHRHLLKIGG